jgi:hypothetical protein
MVLVLLTLWGKPDFVKFPQKNPGRHLAVLMEKCLRLFGPWGGSMVFPIAVLVVRFSLGVLLVQLWGSPQVELPPLVAAKFTSFRQSGTKSHYRRKCVRLVRQQALPGT